MVVIILYCTWNSINALPTYSFDCLLPTGNVYCWFYVSISIVLTYALIEGVQRIKNPERFRFVERSFRFGIRIIFQFIFESHHWCYLPKNGDGSNLMFCFCCSNALSGVTSSFIQSRVQFASWNSTLINRKHGTLVRSWQHGLNVSERT